MTSEPIRVEFRLDRDPRLIAAVSAATQLQAAQAGLDAGSCEQFADAAGRVCGEALQQLAAGEGALEVTLKTFPDRMELSIQHHGQMIPAVGLETLAIPKGHTGRPEALNGLEILACVDRVLFDTEDGMARTTLVKFVPART